MVEENGQSYRTEKLPPEGGFGCIIVIALAMTLCCGFGGLECFGLIFNDFITSCGGESHAVTLIIGSFASALSFGGLLASILIKYFSMRSVGIFGALLYVGGSFFTIFVVSVEQLIVSYGILQGVGIGLILPVLFTTFNSYFIKRRVLMSNLAHALAGIGTSVYPIVANFLMQQFGFRGTIALIAAFNSHVIFGMISMHPVKWHYNVIKIPVEKTFLMKTMNYENDEENNVKRMNEKNHDEIYSNQRRCSSVSVRGMGDVIVSKQCKKIKTNGAWKKIVDFFDLTLFKDLVYLNITIGISLAMCSDATFFTLQPMYMFQLGFSKTDAANVVAVGAFADLISRIFITVMSLCLNTKARYVYMIGASLTILLRFVFLHISDYLGMIIITAIMFFFHTWLYLPIQLVLAEYLPEERFASGYGTFMFIQGNLFLLISPIAGWIRDVTQDYIICFHSLTILMALCVVPWAIEIIYLRIHPRKTDK